MASKALNLSPSSVQKDRPSPERRSSLSCSENLNLNMKQIRLEKRTHRMCTGAHPIKRSSLSQSGKTLAEGNTSSFATNTHRVAANSVADGVVESALAA